MKKFKLFVIFSILALICSIIFTACKPADSEEGDSSATANSSQQASAKSLKDLMSMSFDEMSAADVDRLNLLTGSMDPNEYEAKYGEGSVLGSADGDVREKDILDDITGAIWGKWTKVDIPGAICSNGSQYKIFVMESKGFWNWLLGYTKNLLVFLEPGGACWDYPSCTGQAGIRGAANPNGIPDNYMNFGDFLDPNAEGGSPMAAISPLLLYNHPTGDNVQTARWNKVFVPYCTGDVHSGNSTKVYDDPTGENPSITYHHNGAKNIEKVIEYLQAEFSSPKKMMITGCSAGGVGSLTNYHFFREGLNPEKSYMLNDSGPIFSATETQGNQYLLHQKIKLEWNVDYMINKYEAAMPGFNYDGDMGQLNQALSAYHTSDVLATTLFKRDANYSMYSYARFFNLDENIPEEKEQILQLWAEDIDSMVDTYDGLSNFSYFIPYFRDMNESHCTTIVEWTGTEIENTGIDVGDFIDDILNGNPVSSYHEPDNPSDADVSDFWMELVNLLL